MATKLPREPFKLYSTRSGKWQPERLVFVGQLESGEDVRLCDCEDLKEHSSYVTLSHCWGQTPICGLKKENVLNLRAKIPVSKLPKSFQDAIIITRKLGIEYVWIDSVCIIQDSHDDWFQVSARIAASTSMRCSILRQLGLPMETADFLPRGTQIYFYLTRRPWHVLWQQIRVKTLLPLTNHTGSLTEMFGKPMSPSLH